MKRIKFIIITLLAWLACNAVGHAQGLKAFELPNGLRVFVWEDTSVPDVFGMVAVNVGSKEDPEAYTGLAHYLEHLLFNGTDKIGALDWEKEKPLYEQIIAKYDEHAQTSDPQQREAISKEINELTKKSAQYYSSKEFSNLLQGMGGMNVNAGTSYDFTVYYNSFPPGEIYKWLDIYSERMINPVFRNFQPELETVYEEFNRGQDNHNQRESEFLLSTIFEGHPYARSVIGLADHLKNPRLSQLQRFYHNWYVPENMALILVGNIQTNEVLPIISEKFGRLENRPASERKIYPETPLKGRKEVSAKIARYPQVLLAFPGITVESEDDIALAICASILSNSNETGLIDKLQLDGDLSAGGTQLLSLKERGSVIVYGIPYYDRNQRRYESLRSTEKMLLKEIKKLQEGKFDDWLVQSIKNEMIRSFDLKMESGEEKASKVAEYFFAGRDLNELLNYNERVEAVTIEEIKSVAKKYFGADYYALFLNEGKPGKGTELEKPKYDPVFQTREEESAYSKAFQLLPARFDKKGFADMNEVVSKKINERSRFFYTSNTENNIFSLVLKYGIGTRKMPKLELAAALVNNAGIMGSMDAQEVKQAFSNLGATCTYRVDDDYLYVVLRGFESNLEASCNLMMRQILMPKLDDKQMSGLLGNQAQRRKIEKSNNEILSDALLEYMLYKDKSDYIDRLPLEDILALTVSDLTGEFQRATGYEAEIHYVGARPVDEVYDILSNNLPLQQSEKQSTSPEIRERVVYTENTVLFLPNNDAKQSTIYFYIQGDEYAHSIDPYRNAFNQYLFGNFSGLVLQEIREYRSLAYEAGGSYTLPPLEHRKSFLVEKIGTQADKTGDALQVGMNLLTDMPSYPDRMQSIKNYLKKTASVERPHFRSASMIYEGWRRRGYSQSPATTNIATVESLTFDDILKFYHERIKGRPITIAIVGNPKMIDQKALEQYGKVTRLSTAKLFSEK